jgi:hypothetical protein
LRIVLQQEDIEDSEIMRKYTNHITKQEVTNFVDLNFDFMSQRERYALVELLFDQFQNSNNINAYEKLKEISDIQFPDDIKNDFKQTSKEESESSKDKPDDSWTSKMRVLKTMIESGVDLI